MARISLLPRAASADLTETVDEAAISARAYELWQERGCPIGSAETDWLRAEEELKKRTGVQAASDGGAGETMALFSRNQLRGQKSPPFEGSAAITI